MPLACSALHVANRIEYFRRSGPLSVVGDLNIQRPIFRNALREFCNVLKKGHDPQHPVARNWDIGEEQALAWVHTGCPELRGVGQADPGATEAGEALRERAMAFYHEAVTTRRLPRRRTSDCTTTTLRQTEEPMPLPPQVCADPLRAFRASWPSPACQAG